MAAQESGRALTSEMIQDYQRDGYLLREGILKPSELAALHAAVPAILEADASHRVMERDGTTVRSVYGPHQLDRAVAGVACLRELAGAAMDLIGEQVYIHQSKVNVKAPFVGDQWEWHQDYIYWLTDDGIREPRLVNAGIFLDDVNEFNGPLSFVRGSHDKGILAAVEKEGMPVGYEDAPQWVSTLTADEKYRVRHDVIADLVREGGLASPKGAAGSVLFFHPNILHASAANISPFSRRMLIIVYNAVSNPATNHASLRPDFLAARVVSPVELSDRLPTRLVA